MKASVPWKKLGSDHSLYIDDKYLPENFQFDDPMHILKDNVLEVFYHWQEQLGAKECAFLFKAVQSSDRGKQEPEEIYKWVNSLLANPVIPSRNANAIPRSTTIDVTQSSGQGCGEEDVQRWRKGKAKEKGKGKEIVRENSGVDDRPDKGAATHNRAGTHNGAETHNGADTHNGAGTHNRAGTHNGAVSGTTVASGSSTGSRMGHELDDGEKVKGPK